MRYTLLTILTLSIHCEAEIYKHVDENGRIHYTDSPPDNVVAKEIEIEKPIEYGPLDQNMSDSGSQLRKQDLSDQKRAKTNSIIRANHRKSQKEALRVKCEKAKSDLEYIKDLKNHSNNHYSSGYYEGRIANLKREISDACKLSNFR